MRIGKNRLIPLVLMALLPIANVMAAPSLDEVLAGEHRTESQRARDVYRHPKQTLEFFGIQPAQTVVEIWPGAGWYADILAPYLRESGQYIAAGFVVSEPGMPDWAAKVMADFNARLAAKPEVYGKPEVTELGLGTKWQAAAPGSADLVLTFRNVHNWMKSGTEVKMFGAFFAALKPGGVLGVIEHRAKPGATIKHMIDSGYVTESHVIALAEAAGFRLLERAEINANPKDTADHPAGVWTLPPTLRLGDTDRAKYQAIGESDRMTLKFEKPGA